MWVVLTFSFDDGFRTDITLAELLEKYNFKATFFVTTGKIGIQPIWLSADDIKWLSEKHEIGSHTKNHEPLTKINRCSMINDLVESKKALETITNKSIVGFAYPYGLFNRSVINFVRESGYRYARTTKPWWIGVYHTNIDEVLLSNEFAVDVTLQLHSTRFLNSRNIMIIIRSFKPLFLRAYKYNFNKVYKKNIGYFLLDCIRKKDHIEFDQFAEHLLTILLQLAERDNVKFIMNLWGHSWDIVLNKDALRRFENLLAVVSSLRKYVKVLTLGELFAQSNLKYQLNQVNNGNKVSKM